jgi:predicted butyrate kinase (DUF1464 family)
MATTASGSQQRTEERVQEPAREHDGSIGRLVSAVTSDAQSLVRKEVELAKAEMRQEATNAGKAAGMYGGAGFAGYMVALLLSLTAVFALAHVLDEVWAAMIVAGGWAVIGACLFLLARARMKRVHAKPDQTMQSLKENARWARHPSG